MIKISTFYISTIGEYVVTSCHMLFQMEKVQSASTPMQKMLLETDLRVELIEQLVDVV